MYWDSTFPNFVFFYLFFRVAPHLPTFAFKPKRPCRKRVWWGTSGFLVKLRGKDVVFRWIDGNCPSVIHGSVKNGCISNNSYCYFQISRQFPLNHDYGRKSSISSYKLDFHQFSRVKHSFPSMKIGEKTVESCLGCSFDRSRNQEEDQCRKNRRKTNRWPNSIFQLFLSHLCFFS